MFRLLHTADWQIGRACYLQLPLPQEWLTLDEQLVPTTLPILDDALMHRDAGCLAQMERALASLRRSELAR